MIDGFTRPPDHADRNRDADMAQPGRRGDLEPARGRELPAVRAHPLRGLILNAQGLVGRGAPMESQRSRLLAHRNGADRRSPAPERGLADRFVHRDARQAREYRGRGTRHRDLHRRDGRRQRRHPGDRRVVSCLGGRRRRSDERLRRPGRRRPPERGRPTAVHPRDLLRRARRRQPRSAADRLERQPDHRLRTRAWPQRLSGRSDRTCGSRASPTSTFPRTTVSSHGWTVSNGVGTAKFDRQKIVQYLATNGIHNRVISITIAGTSSGSSPWSFSGSDSVFVKD